MAVVPVRIRDILFIVTRNPAGYQHGQLWRANPMPIPGFLMLISSQVMVLVVVFYDRPDPWLSLASLPIAAGGSIVVIRQHRMSPPNQHFE